MKGIEVGILIITEEQQCDVLPMEIIDIALVLEEHLVVTDIPIKSANALGTLDLFFMW